MVYTDHKLFLYETTVELTVTTNGVYVDNRPMNNTTRLVAHKGLNNEIKFTIRNRDRKPQNVSSSTITAYLIDPNTKRRVVSKILENTGTDIGVVTLVLTNADLQNVSPGLFRMHIARSEADGTESPVFTDQANNVRFDIEITDQADEVPIATQSVTTFQQLANINLGDSANIYGTSALYGNVDRNFEDGLHTMAFYTTTYTGNISIEGSCVEGVPSGGLASTDWFVISNVALANVTSITSTTFNINANWIRVLSYPDDGVSSLDQVQLRN